MKIENKNSIISTQGPSFAFTLTLTCSMPTFMATVSRSRASSCGVEYLKIKKIKKGEKKEILLIKSSSVFMNSDITTIKSEHNT